MQWTVSRSGGAVVAQGELARQDIPLGNGKVLGNISVPYPVGYGRIVDVGDN